MKQPKSYQDKVFLRRKFLYLRYMCPNPPINPKPPAVLSISLISRMLNIGFEKLRHID